MKSLYASLFLPESLQEACASQAMERLKHVDMNCGMRYTSFPRFRSLKPYTRYEHSVGVAKLIYHFTGDEVQSFAGLFHDIATPVFSHVVDFMEGDHMNQEATESRTAQLIDQDPLIHALLVRRSIPLHAVADYHQYPIADNDSPKLSCDRLEYTLGNMVNYGFAEESLVNVILKDLIIAPNESGEAELQFQTHTTALQFARLALACGRIYSGDENRYAMEYLAGILRSAITMNLLCTDDLYGREEAVIAILEHSSLKEDWQTFQNLYEIREGTPEDGLNLDAKRRYIDPLIKDQGRATECDPSFREAVLQFKEESYDRWLKGVSE